MNVNVKDTKMDARIQSAKAWEDMEALTYT